MRILSIDIETFSDVELGRCGVYRYADSPNFDILLFGYSIDGGSVKLIDICSGEELPQFIIDALIDDDVTKTAFNAQFERVCLMKYFSRVLHRNIYLKPSSWICTEVQASMLGLPLNLEGVGKLLKLNEQKMDEGKALIKYFCTPCRATAANGGRTRNMPEDAPEKWEIFKKYNIRDVQVELSIREKIKNYPIPEKEQEFYILDQKINDRGLLVDMELVKQAVSCNKQFTVAATERAYELTGLENPNSVAQMKGWLKERGVEVESLSKKAVTDLVEETDGEIAEALKLRLLMAKTSVKKYEAVERAVCLDGRVHGLFQFYGANRTGRWCLTGDHEVLTSEGWMRLDEWKGGNIACWSPDTEFISFQKSRTLEFDYEGEMYLLESQRCSQLSTPDHKMPYWNKKGFWDVDVISSLSKKRFSIPYTGRRITNCSLEHKELRILIMTQADGHYTRDGDLKFHFSKTRKIERCKRLLRGAEIIFTIYERNDSSVISIKSRMLPLWLRTFRNKIFQMWLLDESADVIFDELEYWDAYRCGPNSIQYSTTNKQNADIIQALANLSGRSATIVKKVRANKNWNDAYIVNIWLNPGGKNEIKNKLAKKFYRGKVYCAETNTGFFVVRRNGKVWITGNSGRLVQFQNLPQNHLKDLELARGLIKEGRFEDVELLFGNVPGVLSELIRTNFIPEEKYRFIVADFSAIEARVISWLAGEKWRLEVFASHGKIYEAAATMMFHVPVESITKCSPLRQKGKISELSCGYGGGVGALKSMGALDMGVKEHELQGLIDNWRSANPHIVKFWWDVDRTAVKAVKERGKISTHGIIFTYKSGMLFVTLPSGRNLVYVKPKIALNKFGREGLIYEGIGTARKWERIETYGPKIVENIVQAVSRDLLAEAMLRLDEAGYKIVAHVHDEVICEVHEGEGSVEEMCAVMTEPPEWIQEGLPLKADGYECNFYMKD
ncbi:DNA polymerase [Clostridium tyrobutyricum]|uniref:DNA polymerase n=1 Tax=Clostridium tyrobutyricum TaxID=1519 RepID=UPI00057FA971|nr:DNA polymerase [Clostridium tyrobutyricum]